jgi:hypothetical protein
MKSVLEFAVGTLTVNNAGHPGRPRVRTTEYAAASAAALTIALTISGFAARLWGTIALHMPF